MTGFRERMTLEGATVRDPTVDEALDAVGGRGRALELYEQGQLPAAIARALIAGGVLPQPPAA